MDGRKLRGIEIAEKGGLEQTKRGWVVPSQYGSGAYLVQRKGGRYVCNCPDCTTRSLTCKHAYAVMHTIRKFTDEDGNTTITETKRLTYSQDWRAYNQAQTNEITLFDNLLKDLVSLVPEPEYRTGRPRKPLKDDLFCAIQKVYSRLSQRRAYTLYKNASERGQVDDAPHFNRIGRVLNREDVTPILHNLLAVSALPLKSVETAFAPDSSGFRTTQFDEYCKLKHGTKKKHQWIKAHIFVGAKTNVIASAQVTEENGGDCPQFKVLVRDAHDSGFNITEIMADKAYSSRENLDLARDIGATPYIPFRTNVTGKARGSQMWTKMYHYFMLNRDEFMQHYHKRSNVETVFQMIKAKLGDKVKSKNRTAQVNELLIKFIAHNIIVLIHEMFELGITPDFGHNHLPPNKTKKIEHSPCKTVV